MSTGLPVALLETSLPLPLVRRGKVRDVYAVDDDRLLLVTTDRISAFDVVMNEAIPYKGAVLTQLTAWWLSQLSGVIEHHLLSADTDEIVRDVPVLAPYREALAGRSMLCVRADVVPIECVIRGYITGSAWKEYAKGGTLAGEPLPEGLRESERLDPPIFSPATPTSAWPRCASASGRASPWCSSASEGRCGGLALPGPAVARLGATA